VCPLCAQRKGGGHDRPVAFPDELELTRIEVPLASLLVTRERVSSVVAFSVLYGDRLKGAGGSDRGDIVREIIEIVNEVARGLPPGGQGPLDDGVPGG
jgi:hypothetical protein